MKGGFFIGRDGSNRARFPVETLMDELSFESTKYNEELINELVKSVSNIRDDKFEFGNDEINLKSSLIIYFLSKKLELL